LLRGSGPSIALRFRWEWLLTSQRLLAQAALTTARNQQWIFQQLIVIAEVLVAEYQRAYALRYAPRDGVRDQPRLSPVLEANRQMR
jgi:hypothetical protein